jgi:mevalonate kinase
MPHPVPGQRFALGHIPCLGRNVKDCAVDKQEQFIERLKNRMEPVDVQAIEKVLITVKSVNEAIDGVHELMVTKSEALKEALATIGETVKTIEQAYESAQRDRVAASSARRYATELEKALGVWMKQLKDTENAR